MNKLKLARNGYLMISVVFYIAGVLYMVLPRMSPLSVCAASGIILTVYGTVKIIGYFSKDLYCLAFQYDFACGLLLIVLGIIVWACNTRIASVLSPGLGLLILLDSVLAVQMSKDAKQFGLETWHVILASSVISGILGALLIVQPFQTPFAARIAAGGALLAAGLKNQCVITCAVVKKEALPPS